MLQQKFWLRTFNVDQGEWWIVKKLIFLQFLQGAGIAFFFTGAFTTFLLEFEITELPWVMVYSAFLLWISGFIYNKAEHRISFGSLLIITTSLMAISILIFRITAFKQHGDWFFYWMLAWFNALYLLNNLQFWGIATQVFDLRQSKRLFGLISSGDIPAKFVGYSMAVLLVPFTGAMNLLYAGAICIFASLPFVFSIAKSGQLTKPSHPKDHAVHHDTNKISSVIRNITGNLFIRDIAFISFLAFLAVIIIDYGFYAEVKHTTQTDVSLGTFIATVGAILRLAALLTKSIFTGRLTSTFGIRKALLITPIIMLILMGIITITEFYTGKDNIILLYLFGAAFITVDVCRTVFNSPALLSAMQPLPTHERLRAHNIVKGIMDPFAYLFAGLILLGFIRLENEVSLVTICFIVISIGIMWIPGIWLVNRQYLKILIQTISHRYFSQEEFSLNDADTLAQIRLKITTGTDLEVISILKMLNSKKDPIAEDLIAQLLLHPSTQVKLETLRLISGNKTDEIKNRLLELIQSQESEIREEAVKAICKIGKHDWGLRQYMENSDSGIQKAALSGMLLNPEQHVQHIASDHIARMIQHGGKADKLQICEILANVKDDYGHSLHHKLLSDPDAQVQASAIKTIGKASDNLSLTELMDSLPRHGKNAMVALQNAGENAIEVMDKSLADGKFPEWHGRIYNLIGRIGGEKAQKLLLKRISDTPQHLPSIIRSLYRTHYQADEETQKQMEMLARIYIVYGVELLHMQKMVGENKNYYILESSINLEVQDIREILLCLFGCIYDRDKMNQVRNGLDSKQNEHIANAMEIIELTIKKDLGQYFNSMFEMTSIEHRCAALRSLLKDLEFQNIDHILVRVLTEKPIQYQVWTKACSLYISKKLMHHLDPLLVKKYTVAENRLLRETAQFAFVSSEN